jgi:hypothetical protein
LQSWDLLLFSLAPFVKTADTKRTLYTTIREKLLIAVEGGDVQERRSVSFLTKGKNAKKKIFIVFVGLFIYNCFLRRNPMTISSPEREAKKVKIAVDRNPVETSFEKWACDLK